MGLGSSVSSTSGPGSTMKPRIDVQLVVEHRKNGTVLATTAVVVDRSSLDVLSELRRKLIESIPDLVPRDLRARGGVSEIAVKVEYRDRNGRELVIYSSAALQQAIGERVGFGCAPKLWVSYQSPADSAPDTWRRAASGSASGSGGSTSRSSYAMAGASAHRTRQVQSSPQSSFGGRSGRDGGGQYELGASAHRTRQVQLSPQSSFGGRSGRDGGGQYELGASAHRTRQVQLSPQSSFGGRSGRDGGGQYELGADRLKDDVSNLSVSQLCNWLVAKLQQSPAKNIQELSSEQTPDFRALVSLLERTNLTASAIQKTAELFAKEDIRSSLMRHKTDKIYGLLQGSPFMMQLQYHIQSMYKPKASDLHPHIKLVEEILTRTSDGWKVVPLDAIKRIVDETVEDANCKSSDRDAYDALLSDVNRLIQLRDASKRTRAAGRGDDCRPGDEYRQLPILPTKSDMVVSDILQNSLPINHVGRPYASVFEYLDTNFKLLREDYIEPLRERVNEYRNRNVSQPDFDMRSSWANHDQEGIYLNVRFHPGFRIGREYIEYQVNFKDSARGYTSWETSKRFMLGSLLCFSEDNFATHFWGLVASREVRDLARSVLMIRILPSPEEIIASTERTTKQSCIPLIEPGQRFVMVESPAFFEAYSHVLKSLQTAEMCHQLAFAKHLIDLEDKVSPPSYLARRPQKGVYNFSSVFPKMVSDSGRDSFDVLGTWPDWEMGTLAESQKEVLKHALTKELALIQGPPGTGKTYVGLLLVRMLLANLKQQNCEPFRRGASDIRRSLQNVSGPILVVCYTNHALDQFLLGIYEHEKSLIRLGGQSKHEELKLRSLTYLVREQREKRALDYELRRAFREAVDAAQQRKGEIEGKYLPFLSLTLVDKHALQEIATPEEIHSLSLWKSRTLNLAEDHEVLSDDEVVQIWLSGADERSCCKKTVKSNITKETSRADFASKNRFDVFGTFTDDQDEEKALQKYDPYDGFSIASDEDPYEVEEPDADTDSSLEEEIAPVEELQLLDMNRTDDEPGNGFPSPEHCEQITPEDDFINVGDVWRLPRSMRQRLHQCWLMAIKRKAQQQIERLSIEYEEACKARLQVEKEGQLCLLRQANVVGMTTTAAARMRDTLACLKPEIVIVEEAAEVLESHILACLSPYTKHLVLIGDHQQLRPTVSVHRLAVHNKLDVSLFERLVVSGVEYKSLKVQRRMRPTISNLLLSIYPDLKDDASVAQFPDVRGLKHNVYFLDHQEEESSVRDSETGSKVNKEEAKLIVEFCIYLLKQDCYSAKDITILSMYSGQVENIRRLLNVRVEARCRPRVVAAAYPNREDDIPRVTTVDGFQGEESKIILLSLVRNNKHDGTGDIGFLNIRNRVCVALSRAKHGMYIFGNADLLAERSEFWGTITGTLRQSSLLGPELTLCCHNHPERETKVSRDIDFRQVEDGGCGEPCGFQLPCGHGCPRRCHPSNHEQVVCSESCSKQYENCEHSCSRICHQGSGCPPCTVLMKRQLPGCGHEQAVPCSEPVDSAVCQGRCDKPLGCGHPCSNKCSVPCVEKCLKLVTRTLPCGHVQEDACHEDIASIVCRTPCTETLERCSHKCSGSCGLCKQGAHHVPCPKPCQLVLPCGHACPSSCADFCPPCERPCQKKCVHVACTLKCGEECIPCREKCAWKCRHHRCNLLCFETCTRPRCNRRCNRRCNSKLPGCGHRCSGLCGELCPKKCKICNGDTIDFISKRRLAELKAEQRLVQLHDCKHVFEVTGLDRWMDQGDGVGASSSATAINLMHCPQCRTPIRRSYRYGKIVKTTLEKIEVVKRRVRGYQQCSLGNQALNSGRALEAVDIYQQALKHEPGLPETHYGLGCAYSAAKLNAKASFHLLLVVCTSQLQAHPAGAAASRACLVENDIDYCKGIASSMATTSCRAENSIAVKAMVQLARTCTRMKQWDIATQLSAAVLDHDPDNEDAKAVISHARSKTQSEPSVAVMPHQVGYHAHWYHCPNGHVYALGEKLQCCEPLSVPLASLFIGR